MENMFRDLRADEIDVRIAQVKENGVSLLLYKDARVDQNILDEKYGAFGWQRDHNELKGNIYCGISIYDEERKQWVTKWDVGKESFSEAEKGEASDSFKRAGFNWGIGRELYTAPFIWINAEDCNLFETNKKDAYGKPIWTCRDKFEVEKIEIKDKEITGLAIKNMSLKGRRVFVYFIKEEK